MSDAPKTDAVATIQPPDKTVIEYVPFGGQAKIKLSVAIIKNLVCNPTRSGKVCDDRQALKFLMLCQAQQLNPFAGDAFLIGYDGKNGPEFSLITAHVAFLKRAEVSADFDGMESGIIVEDRETGEVREIEGDFYESSKVKVLGGWAIVHHKKRKIPTKRKVRLERFQKPFGVWQDDAAGMICKCFDEETEVLTSRGFERFSNAEGNVLCVTESGLSESESVPFVQNYSGPMVSMLSDDLNFSVTPNHDMVTAGGKIEAGKMMDLARSRASFYIPRIVPGTPEDYNVSDQALKLAAAYLADGSDKPHCSFWISVSKPRKVMMLDALGLHHAKHARECEGDAFETDVRTITTRANKVVFGFRYTLIDEFVSRGKVPTSSFLKLSKRQARVFVDTLVECDGYRQPETGVRRFYSSRPEIMGLFEMVSVIAGYSVSNRKSRTSDIGRRVNYYVTISDRDLIPVKKWPDGRASSLIETTNTSGKVWCVTVPSGIIVVRRRGFSMLCGNCAEADALRSTFPTLLGGLYHQGEMPVIDIGPTTNKPEFKPRLVEGSPAKEELFQDKPEEKPAEQTPTPEPAADAPKKTPQQQLAELVEGAGFDFSTFQQWADESGNVENATAMAYFDQITTKTAEKLVKASVGLLKGLELTKKGAK